jgi:hypothetical protein
MAASQEVGRHLRIALLILWAVGSAGITRAATYYVTVAGLGGTPEYEAQFAKWSAELDRALRANGPDAHVESLAAASATRQRLEETLNRLAGELHADDDFALLLIGHGTFDGTDYKFNLPGPDITATELSSLLDRIPSREQLIVNMTSASGASLSALAKKDRIIITATKSGNEKNATVFARYWIDGLRDPAADTDKDGSVSALEAFRYAESKTAAYFKTEKLLASEHSMLSDTGTANAVRDPKPENGQGLLAARFPLIRPPSQTVKAASPEKQELLARKQRLEARIDKLKYQKAAMSADAYKQQLTSLLLDLARTQAEIDR